MHFWPSTIAVQTCWFLGRVSPHHHHESLISYPTFCRLLTRSPFFWCPFANRGRNCSEKLDGETADCWAGTYTFFVLTFAQKKCSTVQTSASADQPATDQSILLPTMFLLCLFSNLIIIMHLFAKNVCRSTCKHCLPLFTLTTYRHRYYPSANVFATFSFFTPLGLQQAPLYRVHYLCIACILAILWQYQSGEYVKAALVCLSDGMGKHRWFTTNRWWWWWWQGRRAAKAVKKQRCTWLDDADDSPLLEVLLVRHSLLTSDSGNTITKDTTTIFSKILYIALQCCWSEVLASCQDWRTSVTFLQ